MSAHPLGHNIKQVSRSDKHPSHLPITLLKSKEDSRYIYIYDLQIIDEGDFEGDEIIDIL